MVPDPGYGAVLQNDSRDKLPGRYRNQTSSFEICPGIDQVSFLLLAQW